MVIYLSLGHSIKYNTYIQSTMQCLSKTEVSIDFFLVMLFVSLLQAHMTYQMLVNMAKKNVLESAYIFCLV